MISASLPLMPFVIMSLWQFGTVYGEQSQNQMRFRKFETPNVRFHNETLGYISVSSQIECGVRCMKISGCIAFSYCSAALDFSASCRLENRSAVTANVESSDGCDIFQTVDTSNQNEGTSNAFLPSPDYYWDLTGKCSVTDICTVGTGSSSCSTKVVYANIGDRNATTEIGVYPLTQRTHVVTGNSVCAISTDGVGNYHYISLGDFSGRCLLDTDQCTNGLTVGFWTQVSWEDMSESSKWYLLSSGAQTAGTRGVAVYVELIVSKIYVIGAILKDSQSGYSVSVNYTQYSVPGCWSGQPSHCDWIHIAFAWNPTGQLDLYVNGQVVDQGSSSPQSNAISATVQPCINRPHDGHANFGNASYSDLKIFEQYLDSDLIGKLYVS
ncbi:uncharacterized protein LOC106176197 [Lingula anatina]|uniref:Uncharacterized protein LOC106176197 n=1 Tax=Lingula anatina TaxID=7574 RepID=A0A1S3JU66_LINAN|nr:uncharacterized protein LOC106176197 [Lingula anatina]|eukprot:XP_013413915.1 uncharacterized protein LOC106176197 [Lingula anatina]